MLQAAFTPAFIHEDKISFPVFDEVVFQKESLDLGTLNRNIWNSGTPEGTDNNVDDEIVAVDDDGSEEDFGDDPAGISEGDWVEYKGDDAPEKCPECASHNGR